MKDIEKEFSRKPLPIKTTSLKPVEYFVLSEDKSCRVFHAPASSSGWLPRLGIVLKHYRKTISFIQWLFVILYLSLLLLPLLLLNIVDEPFYASVSGVSRLMFWGVGWPVIILSMMFTGRVWCGLFCPDGTLTELLSRHGRKRSIPRWVRWKGWPCTVLVMTVLYGQLIDVYDNFLATLALLGIPTTLALISGYMYGNGKRIWCMYLCPGNGIFGLLGRMSPLYYKVDVKKWNQYSGEPERLDCPVLINVRQMQGMSACHACGRCLGHRNAVELGFRSPSSEILATSENAISGHDMLLLLWGIIGICTTALAWRGNGLYAHFSHFLSQLISLHGSDLPWYFSASPESPSRLIFILISGSVMALATFALLRLSALFSGKTGLWKQLALCLIPISGTGIFLGLCQISLTLWQAHGFHLECAPIFQSLILAGAVLFSIWLGIKTIFNRISVVNLIAFFVYCLPVTLLSLIWIIHFKA